MTREIPTWDEWFIEQAHVIKKKSKDKHTQCGCIIVSQDNRPLSQGYNSLPSKANDDLPERFERDLKYSYMVHAERNAFYSAARAGIALKGSKIYITAYPCIDCTHGIIQCGIVEVIYDVETNEKWSSPKYNDISIQEGLFKECGVLVRGWKMSEEKKVEKPIQQEKDKKPCECNPDRKYCECP